MLTQGPLKKTLNDSYIQEFAMKMFFMIFGFAGAMICIGDKNSMGFNIAVALVVVGCFICATAIHIKENN